ncbi:hypothetical protein Mp_3g03640 [Marchantia polymorpha subsp. ruderalis]|uniref:Uncharacterized protein n=2 Tax=Marchantia polymorpha TaxID=3197 RepID=A0AAF6AX39_MARPO|nr:hypothetical protein MARPO_0022s0168 [Marchantia polymorpha]BBN04323.1 hypothetical protein Mp_3g03640 [Marchantia polymorpha subsp. ruderalis]|eukprot:PTQ44082.1 hypothetical protein MARPO_0022s0168 [Marchantia polymorpha]
MRRKWRACGRMPVTIPAREVSLVGREFLTSDVDTDCYFVPVPLRSTPAAIRRIMDALQGPTLPVALLGRRDGVP